MCTSYSLHAGHFPEIRSQHAQESQETLVSVPETNQKKSVLTSAKALGMDQRISRRDFLNATLLASGSVLLNSVSPQQLLAAQQSGAPTGVESQDDWTGYGGVGDYANSNGNTKEIMDAGHQIREGQFDSLPQNLVDTGEIYDCVVVGGGISGLAAALFFQRLSGKSSTCLVLDNHAIFGGEAKRNEFIVDGHRLIAHQGSAMWFPPLPGTFLEEFYESIHIRSDGFQYQEWTGAQPPMRLG